MDVSAGLLLCCFYLTDVCVAQGRISWKKKLLVRIDVSDKVHIIFCLTQGRKWKWQLAVKRWLWLEIEGDFSVRGINVQLLCGNIFMMCDLCALLHCPGFNVWTHALLHFYLKCLCDGKEHFRQVLSLLKTFKTDHQCLSFSWVKEKAKYRNMGNNKNETKSSNIKHWLQRVQIIGRRQIL